MEALSEADQAKSVLGHQATGCSQLIHIVHKRLQSGQSLGGPFVNNMNNLQTVTRLGIGKFISGSNEIKVFLLRL